MLRTTANTKKATLYCLMLSSSTWIRNFLSITYRWRNTLCHGWKTSLSTPFYRCATQWTQTNARMYLNFLALTSYWMRISAYGSLKSILIRTWAHLQKKWPPLCRGWLTICSSWHLIRLSSLKLALETKMASNLFIERIGTCLIRMLYRLSITDAPTTLICVTQCLNWSLLSAEFQNTSKRKTKCWHKLPRKIKKSPLNSSKLVKHPRMNLNWQKQRHKV